MYEKQCARIIRLADVLQATSYSKSTIYKLEAEGRFPARICMGSRVGWYEHEVNAWVLSRDRKSAVRHSLVAAATAA